MAFPKVLVIYNEPVLPLDHPDAASEHDVLETADAIVDILRQAGFPTRRLGFSFDPRRLLDEIREDPPDVVFNLFEGIATQTGTEISVAGLLEWLNIPFTGAPSFAIALGRDKVRTKHLLQGAGLPTAEFVVTERSAPNWPFAWPAIVKPALQDSSVGIDQGSVVTDQKGLEDRVAYIVERYGAPVLVERFIFGREFHASVIEEPGDTSTPIVVPLAEIRFEPEPGTRTWPIYSYTAKWTTDSAEYNHTPLDSPVYLAQHLMERISSTAIQAYRLIGLRDYGRIDFRVTDDGTPYILEANPNPYISSSLLINGLEAMGRSHSRFVVDMVRGALARGGKASTPS